MNKRKQQIGIDRLIRLEWLEYTANLVLAGNNVETVEEELNKLLTQFFPSSSPNTRGSLSKTRTILIKTWLRAPREIQSLKEDGIELLRDSEKTERIAIQWGMIMAAYPFWGAVAEQTGRLLKLQEIISAKQVQRRLREQYGERETVFRRVRYVLRAFIDWGVLKETQTKGIYEIGEKTLIQNHKLITWLVEASLHAAIKETTTMRDILDSPKMFPFRFDRISADRLGAISSRLEIIKHGLDDNLVMLRK